jgi:tetratricopeptide (TPR) repeat protein
MVWLFFIGAVVAPAMAQDPPAPAGGEAGAQAKGQASFERGDKLFRKGEFEEAVEAFESAVKACPGTKAWKARLAMARRALKVFKITQDESHKLWPKAVMALHNFYLGHDLPKKALPLDLRLYERFPSADTGRKLVETHMMLDQNAESVKILDELLSKGENPDLRLLRARMHARLGHLEKARADLGKAPKKLKGPVTHYNRACTYALLGEAETALKDLVRTFELTPPAVLPKAKERAGKNKDLASLHGTPGFKKALETASTVKPAPGCGGSCSSCPHGKKTGGTCGGEKGGTSKDKGGSGKEKEGCPGSKK